MYKFEALDPKPIEIEIEFSFPTHIHISSLEGTTQSVKTVSRVKIFNPLVVTYHTYGKGSISYYVEYFSNSVRPLRKYIVQFDTLQVKSIKFVYPKLSINK